MKMGNGFNSRKRGILDSRNHRLKYELLYALTHHRGINFFKALKATYFMDAKKKTKLKLIKLPGSDIANLRLPKDARLLDFVNATTSQLDRFSSVRLWSMHDIRQHLVEKLQDVYVHLLEL